MRHIPEPGRTPDAGAPFANAAPAQAPAARSEGAPPAQGKGGEPHKKLWAALAVLLVLLIAAAIALFVWLTSPDPNRDGLQPDPNVKVGSLSGDFADLDKIVDEGMLTFSINSTPVFGSGTAGGNLMIENPDVNNNRFTVEITRDDTGETVYRSGALDPGQYIDDVPLDVALPAGEYACTATFSTFRIADDTPIGQAAAGLTITVLN